MTQGDDVRPEEILRFWFEETDPKAWWTVDPAFDTRLRERFGALLDQAARGELYAWRETPGGRLAEVIVLDQFSRNIHRETPRAFAQDPMALVLAQEAVAAAAPAQLTPIQRSFLYMPYMHSESPLIHTVAERLFRENGLEDNTRFELLHKAIVDRFGRYPHRNAVLGRVSSSEELVFLKEPGSRF